VFSPSRHSGRPAGWSISASAEARLGTLTSPVVVFAAAFLILFLRRPQTLTVAEFWADDGHVFTHALDRGLATLLEPFTGPLILAQRAVVLTESWLPPYWAPVWGNIVALAITAFVATFLATRLPLDAPRRLAIALAFVLLPGSAEVIGSMSHIQWVTGALVVAYPFAVRQRTWELVPLAAAALTGPLALLAMPLYIGRWWTDPSTLRPLLVVAVCAAVQAVTLITNTDARAYFPVEWALVPEVMVSRVTHIPGFVGILVVGMVLIVSARLRRPAVVGLWALVIAIPLSGVLNAPEPTASIYNGGATRYFWLATGLLVAMVIASRSGWTRTVAIAVFIAVFAREVALPTREVAGWAERSACIGGLSACAVPVEPTTNGIGDFWAVRWTP
jgi:hypothetical protein